MASLPSVTSSAEADCVDAVGDECAPRTRRPRWAKWWLIACGVVVLLVAALLSAANTDGDSRTDLRHLIDAAGKDFVSLRWQYTCVVLALAALHYVATAIAARAAAGIPLPLGETLLVQLAAAAANRLTPAGLGASAVNARYFSRRGLAMPAALGAVIALSVLGAVADLIVLSALVLGGLWLGLSGGSQQIQLLGARVANLVAPLLSPWLWAGLGVGAVIALVWRRRKHRGRPRDWRQLWTPVGALLRRPSSLATLLTASGATTLILAFAFVASTAMVPGPRPAASLGALLIAFMVGAAAGSAVPVPAGIGSTETALAAVLIAMHVPAGHAIQEVLIFRVLTFWLPAIVGVLATRRLNRRHAI
ncbi:MAG: hypothetical protein QOG22_669 [Pseudonocardiales bacterium]|jgi:uncharacterized membrane protein YbhN (UPF0104 family)|nr:hypothetical protein [Pseudonocardiales bacterium]MDT4970526.1 hypothetical protein [Pseudonocardiales bacterium]MDT4976884.1 hypothetical protein [Pseudonocardiales bacterium]